MGHEFESGMYGSGRRAWHGLGTVVEGLQTAEDAINLAGLNWEVDKKPIYIDSGFSYKQVESDFAIVRRKDDQFLGIVKGAYTPLQNKEAFGFFDSIVSNKEAIYETAGSLRNGRIIWLLAKLPGEIVVKGRDITNKYVLLANSHDGSSCVQIKLTGIRCECMNMLTMALRGGSYKIRHTSEVKDKVEQASLAMGFANKQFQELNEIYNNMADRSLTVDQTVNYFKKCLKKAEHSKKQEMTEDEFFDNGEDEGKDTKALVKLVNLHETGMIDNIGRGNLFSAYNTVVEYVDHGRKYRSEDSKMFDTAFGGFGMKLKTNAYSEAIKLLK